MRIAWFTPLSTRVALKGSLIAQAAIASCPSHWEIEFFSAEEDLDEASSWQPHENIFHFLRFSQRNEEKAFDFVVYSIEDHRRYAFVEKCLGQYPGMCFFHDTAFPDLFFERFRHSTAGTDLNKEFSSRFPEARVNLGDYHARKWDHSAFKSLYKFGYDCFQKPLVGVFENKIQARRSGMAFSEVFGFPRNILCSDSSAEERRILRSILQLKSNELVFGFFGSQPVMHRLYAILNSLLWLETNNRSYTGLWFVCGSEEEVFANRMLNRFGLSSVRVVCANSQTEYLAFPAVCDLLICPEYENKFGASLFLLSSLAKGLSVVVSKALAAREGLTGDNLFTVSSGVDESREISRVLEHVVDNKSPLSVIKVNKESRFAFQEIEQLLLKNQPFLSSQKCLQVEALKNAENQLLDSFRNLGQGVESFVGEEAGRKITEKFSKVAASLSVPR